MDELEWCLRLCIWLLGVWYCMCNHISHYEPVRMFLLYVMQRFQGGNLYPYFSEVIRSGFNKFLFVSGCSIGFIPSLLFSANYLKTSLKYGKLFKSMFTRVVYNICQVVRAFRVVFSDRFYTYSFFTVFLVSLA